MTLPTLLFLVLETLPSPAGKNAMASFLSTHGADLYLSWIENDQLFLTRHNGRGWSEPQLVRALGD